MYGYTFVVSAMNWGCGCGVWGFHGMVDKRVSQAVYAGIVSVLARFSGGCSGILNVRVE